MSGINFNDLPSEIKSMVFHQNRVHNNNTNRDRKLKDFWDEWEDQYQDDLEEFYNDGDISSWDWDELTIKEKINMYRRHERMVVRHESILCDGSDLDDFY
tara:strand:+ start:184 stop:483 length:300 start_codon:yes stop_codon:yes gene_type:complete